jgi:hypothetical protein
VRVPIPAVILLVLAVLTGVWWTHTRGLDFVTPPTSAQLEEIRLNIESSFPQTQHPSNAISAPSPATRPLPKTTSAAAVPITITLHTSAGPSLAETLPPILSRIASEITQASAGTVDVKIKISAGKSEIKTDGPRPLALWLAGASPNSSFTDVLSFTTSSQETLHNQALQTIFKLVSSHLARSDDSPRPTTDLPDDADPSLALRSQISLADWQKFAKSMNQAPKAGE